jgi:MFS family permease
MKGIGFFRRQMAWAMALILAVVLAAIAATVALAYRSFEASVGPQVLAKARTAGQSLADTLALAAKHELPLDRLVGVDALFAESRASYPEFARIELLRDGHPLFSQGSAAAGGLVARVAVSGYERDRAEVTVTVDPAFVRRLFREMTLDLAVVALVALFVSLELLYFLAAGLLADVGRLRAQLAAMARGAFVPLARPEWLGVRLGEALERRREAVARRREAAPDPVRRSLDERFTFVDARGARSSQEAAFVLGAMRMPFFLLLLADDLSRAFLPLFAAGLPAGGLALSPNLVASLPVVVFMAVVALSQPVLGGWSERIGRRRSFLAGACIALVAHALSAQSSSLPELLAWRSAGGAAWAIAFVAAQGYVLDHTDSRTRTTGLAAFVGIIMVSLICGPSIGGILADGMGHRGTLALGAVLAGLGLALAWRRLPPDAPRDGAPPPAARGSFAAVLANRRFLALLVLAAVPAKVILIAFCYYLIPLYIVELGSTAAMAGRLIMLYSVMMVILVPWMAAWVVARRGREAARPEPAFVAAGLALSGLAGLAMALPFGVFSAVALVLLLGLGQSLSISPQAAMVAEVCREEIATIGQGAVYGVYRLVERLGNAAGPLLGAVLLEAAGFQGAFVAIGTGVLACAVLFAAIFLPRRAAGALARGSTG